MDNSSVILRSRVKTLTRKHASITNERDWVKHIYTNLEIDSSTAIAYVRKYRYRDTFIFTIQEYGERMSPQYAAEMSDIVIRPSDFQTADLGPMTLEKALIDMDNASVVSKLLVSNTVTAGKIILRFAEDRTLTAPFKDLETRVGDIVEMEVVDVSGSVFSELESCRNSPDSSVRNVSLNTDSIDRLQTSSTASLTHALTQALTALSLPQAAGTKIDETNKKLGYIGENTFRQNLNMQEGIPWSQSFRFSSLNEIVEWTGLKIKSTKEERSKALRDIVRMCVSGFEGYTDANDQVDWMKLSAYGRLYHFLLLARRCKGYKVHAWREKGEELIEIIDDHKKSLPYNQGTAMVQAAVMRYLLHQDNPLSLAVFLMLINPSEYEPQVGKNFKSWTWPKTDYEMDHEGQFIETTRDVYVYSGGESKWSHTMLRDARDQVEERVRILDAVMNLGYCKRTIFTMRLFVPILGSSLRDIKVDKRIRVMRRRQLPEGIDKSVQTVVGEGKVDVNEGPERTGDDGGGDEASQLLPEIIEYMVRTETLETWDL